MRLLNSLSAMFNEPTERVKLDAEELSVWTRLWNLKQFYKGLIFGRHLPTPDADLRGHWVLITGASNGVGREAALQFARWGANLVLACREPEPHEHHPEAVVEECRKAARDAAAAEIEWWEVDMARLATVDALAHRWNETGRALDILCNNAGVGGPSPGGLTEDGFEPVHQINFLAHVLLTLAVLPSIARARAPRIICTTSNTQFIPSISSQFANTLSLYDKARGTYERNKLFFQMWLTELQIRCLTRTRGPKTPQSPPGGPSYTHIAVHGAHPGFVETSIWRPMRQAVAAGRASLLGRLVLWAKSLLSIGAQQGSLAITTAATAREGALMPDDAEWGSCIQVGRDDHYYSDRLRGGAKYFNRVWEDMPAMEVRNRTYRRAVWSASLAELRAPERDSISAEIKRDILADLYDPLLLERWGERGSCDGGSLAACKS